MLVGTCNAQRGTVSTHVVQCMDLASGSDISSRRITLLLAITQDWLALATKMEEYEAVLESERSTTAKHSV